MQCFTLADNFWSVSDCLVVVTGLAKIPLKGFNNLEKAEKAFSLLVLTGWRETSKITE